MLCNLPWLRNYYSIKKKKKKGVYYTKYSVVFVRIYKHNKRKELEKLSDSKKCK